MGNNQTKIDANSEQKEINKYLLQMDMIAANYATTLNLHQMTHLTNNDYCNNLTIISSDKIAKNLSSSQVHYLEQRLEKGIPIDKMTDDKIVYFKNENLDVQNPTKKRRICIGIAEFYIKLSHIYAAIFKTIQPTYVYKDEEGNLISFSLEEKHKIPKNVHYQTTYVNFCNQRIQSLINKNNYSDKDENINVQPDFCTIHLNDKDGSTKNLSQLTGMVEFEKLFYDVFDYDKGVYNKISDKMKVEYEDALQTFYEVFTGNKDKKPDTIKSFKDITLKDYHNGKGCKDDGTLKKKAVGSLKIKVFQDYALQLKKMLDNSNKKQEEILNIISELFSFIKDDTSGKEHVIIQPTLTKIKLDDIALKARKLIKEMYVQCEKDFFDALLKYQAIIIFQGKELQEKQIDNLEKEIEDTILT
tara:strand:+ start:980 stop:2224 length:1245 start_codon:yes stop_codon:yes gene_type:complete